MFAVGGPAEKFRFDAVGLDSPHGYTVTNPRPADRAAVTFNTAASASAGTPARPPTCNSYVEPAPTAADTGQGGCGIPVTRTDTARTATDRSFPGIRDT
jgi:hypothetical protein